MDLLQSFLALEIQMGVKNQAEIICVQIYKVNFELGRTDGRT